MTTINKLTALSVGKITEKGLYSDGDGLYLRVDGGKRWVFIFQWLGSRKEMGLGPVTSVTLAQAREAKRVAKDQLRTGLNPIDERRRQRQGSKTFGEFAEELLDGLEAGWSNAKHRQQWRNTLKTYAKGFWKVPVDKVATEHVLKALRPIWLEKPETAQRVRGRIERVLDAAKAKGLRSGANPAVWRGHLSTMLPKPPRGERKHHEAMPFADVPDFMVRLRGHDAVSAWALEFTILTAARSGETLGAQWSEFDLESKVWTVPAVRMKARSTHRVPLCDQVISLLERVKGLDSEFLFPATDRTKPLSNMSMEMLLRRMKVTATPHGFRSSFRDWVGETTDYPREIAEAALAHKVGDEVERAYRRGDALEKRRTLMQAWADYCGGTRKGQAKAEEEPPSQDKTRSENAN